MDAKARADCIKEIDLLKVKDLFRKCATIIKKCVMFFIDIVEVSTGFLCRVFKSLTLKNFVIFISLKINIKK